MTSCLRQPRRCPSLHESTIFFFFFHNLLSSFSFSFSFSVRCCHLLQNYFCQLCKLGERKSLPAANGGLSLQEPPSHRVITPGNISATISMGSTSHQHGRSEYRNRRPHHHHHHHHHHQPGSKIKARISNLPIAIHT